MLNFQERENNFIRIIPESSNCKTKKKLLEQRKLETNQINLKTFSNLTIGIHGKELPKFSENLEEYWKVRNEWKESPKNSTQTELLLSRNQKRLQGENVSDFKKNSEKKVGESAEKPRNFSGKGENVPAEGDKSKKATPAVHKYRPSTIFGYFLKSKTPETLKIDAKTVQTREKSRGEPRISVIENNTQGISTTYQTKSRSFIKKQGTSSRMLRSRGFIS